MPGMQANDHVLRKDECGRRMDPLFMIIKWNKDSEGREFSSLAPAVLSLRSETTKRRPSQRMNGS